MEVLDVKKLCEKIKANISKVIVGKEDVIDLALVSLLSSGHVLLEDVPGVGKTMLAKCLAKSIDCSFSRIQFTPDLLPSDITGINYYNQKNVNLSLDQDLFLQIFCWQMKLTGQLQEHSQVY